MPEGMVTSTLPSSPMAPFFTHSTILWKWISERSSTPAWKTAPCFSTAFTSVRPSPIVNVGFSQKTSFPASRAMIDIGTCQ